MAYGRAVITAVAIFNVKYAITQNACLGGVKKNMKTKIIAVLIALVVMVSLGSAALVGYLSNTVHNDIEVTSPLEIHDYTVGDIVAGSVTCYSVSVENHANRNICGRMQTTVTNDTGAAFDGDGLEIYGSMMCDGVMSPCIRDDYIGDGVYTFEPCICFTAEDVEVFDVKIYAHPLLEPDDYNFDTVVVPCDEYCDGWTPEDWYQEDCECNCCDEDAMCEWCLCEDGI